MPDEAPASAEPIIDSAYAKSMPLDSWVRPNAVTSAAAAIDPPATVGQNPVAGAPQPGPHPLETSAESSSSMQQEAAAGPPPDPAEPAPAEGASLEASPPEESTESDPLSPELTPEQRLAKADEVLALLSSDPDAFVQQHGVNQFGPRFAALANESSRLRQREQVVKQGRIAFLRKMINPIWSKPERPVLAQGLMLFLN